MERKEVEQLILSSPLGGQAAALMAGLRESVRLNPGDVAQREDFRVGVSRIGGLPDWPAGRPYPRYRETCMDFVAQIALADVAGWPGVEGLPGTGLLQFFFNAYGDTSGTAEDAGSWAVVYLGETPDALAYWHTPPEFDLDAIFPAHALTFHREWQLPPTFSPEWDALQLSTLAIERAGTTPPLQKAYERLCDALQADSGVEGGEHRMGGYPASLSEEVFEECDAYAPASTAGPWRLLLQLDAEGIDAGYGVQSYCLREGDWAKGEFGQAWSIVQH